MALIPFDKTDPKNIGRPEFFDWDAYIATIDSYMFADEIETALWLINHPPAWYREKENYPEQLKELKRTIYKNLYSPIDYATDEAEAGWTKEAAENQWLSPYTTPRAEILMQIMQQLNQDGKTPWIGELSTSHGNLPLGLAKHGVKFNFYAQNLNQKALDKIISWLPDGIWKEAPDKDQYKIFVFTEALEHVYREEDLLQMYTKMDIDFDMIFMSTPYGCLWHGLNHWKDRRLGHVRGYTREEFCSLAQKFFPGYIWQYYFHHSQVLVGTK
jgi:hypothetical protein